MKAPEDIDDLCRRSGMTGFPMPQFPSEKGKLYQKAWLFFVCSSNWRKLRKVVCDGDIVLYQHPMYGNRVALRFIPKIREKKNCRFVAVIHDLESLRKGIAGVIERSQKTNEISDNDLLKQFDAVICHNEHMKEYLVSQGFEADKLVCLGIFDYLCDCDKERSKKSDKPEIAIAGNLVPGKCAYIYDILGRDKETDPNPDLTVHLYGNNFDENAASGCMVYHGSYTPEELPAQLEGDFGLVWDGPSARTCEGNTGEYLKYNDPHKTSLYLASGMPVIVWSQAAIADFVLENGAGIAVDSLYRLDDVISDISADDYARMCERAGEIGKKIRSGFYFTGAWNQCMKILEK